MARELPKKRKKKFKLKKIDIILGIVVLIGLISYGGYYYFTNVRDNKNTPNNNAEEKKPEETKKLSIVDPGSKTRPYAVMINNIGTARPLQSGLQDAYIMYELIVEGGITRYLALFMDVQTERIGSIRSARHYYLDYALENDAIYVHHGQSPQASSDFKSLGIDRIAVDESKTGWRDKKLNVSSEHTLFTSMEKLGNGLSGKRTERNKDLLLDYSIDPIDIKNMEGVQIASSVSIKYSNSITSSYEYDEASGVYKRFVNDKEHKDYVTGKQYTFKNIITYQVKNSNISGDDKGRQEFNNVGEGSGYYITNGYAVPIKWSKSSRSATTVYKYENGEEIKVNDGNTFIQIQPKNETLKIS